MIGQLETEIAGGEADPALRDKSFRPVEQFRLAMPDHLGNVEITTLLVFAQSPRPPIQTCSDPQIHIR
jgi:hypothetical protein